MKIKYIPENLRLMGELAWQIGSDHHLVLAQACDKETAEIIKLALERSQNIV